MFILKNSLIKVFFKNGTIVEGIVLFWNDKKGIITSPHGNNRMMIYHPSENVMMIEIIVPKQKNQKSVDNKIFLEQAQPPITSDQDSKPNISSKTLSEKTKKLIEYRLSQSSKERKLLAKKLQNTSINEAPIVDFSKQCPEVQTKYYESPDFSKYRPFVSSRKKNT